MRKLIIILFLLLPLCFCSFFKSKKLPYPTGVVFPLAWDGEVSYKGEIIDLICRQREYLFLSTKKGFVYAIDGKKRKINWFFQADENLASPPYLGKDNIYVYDYSGTVYCLNRKGKLIWKKKIEEKITSGIKEYEGKVFLGTEKGVFFSLENKQGKKLWAFQVKEAIRSTPIVALGKIIFGCDDHHLYFLDFEGHLLDQFETGGAIQATALVDGSELYFGSNDQHFYCLDLKRNKMKWKIKMGCRLRTSPVTDKKRIFSLCWNGILYCLNKKNGTILWWKSVPARSSYRLTLIESRVVVTSLSNFLVSFDAKTGEKVGEFDASQTIQSNPVWLQSYLLINLYDYEKGEGRLVYLKKVVHVNLLPSKKSPRKTGKELIFTASDVGLFMPKYEFTRYRLIRVGFNPTFFILSVRWEEKVVQANSEKNTWEWFPETSGFYVVSVEVSDEKETLNAKIPFIIEKEMPKISLRASKESPQKTKEKIAFGASATVLQMPQYEFSLSRLWKMEFNPAFCMLFIEWEKKVVQARSEKSSWEWSPENQGLYAVGVKAADKKEEAENRIPFLILRVSVEEIREMIFYLKYWTSIHKNLLIVF